MSEASIEMLAPEQVQELWPAMEPLFAEACKSNEIAQGDICAEDIRRLAVTGMAAVLASFEDKKLACVMAVQFNDTNGHKCADIIAFAGKGLMRGKMLYWKLILEWLRQNGVEFLDAYANNRLAKIYLKKFGFTKSCTYVRMELQGAQNE